MKAVFSFLLITLTGTLALADVTVVKVMSHFHRDSDAKLEGTGILINISGVIHVLTSEHVVLPSAQNVVHVIRNKDGFSGEAVFVRSHWELGLALLKVTQLDRDFYIEPRLPKDDFFERNPEAISGKIWAWGYPIGSEKLKSSDGGSFEGTWGPGRVLAKQGVSSIQGLRVETGMSGGAVFSGDEFYGMLTHATFARQSRAYVISSNAIYRWLNSRTESFVSRSVEDIQAQVFSRSDSETVHWRSAVVEKREGRFFIRVPKDFWMSRPHFPADWAYDYPGLQEILIRVSDLNLRVAEVTGFGFSGPDMKLTPQTSLVEFFHLLSVRGRNAQIRDGEPSLSEGSDNLRPVPYFTPRQSQEVKYSMQQVLHDGSVKKGNLLLYLDVYDANGESTVLEQELWPGQNSYAQPERRWDLMSTDRWRDLLATCESKEVVEVPAGRFQTCRKTRGNRIVWYGPVPIDGIVKEQSRDGSFLLELTKIEYRFSQ